MEVTISKAKQYIQEYYNKTYHTQDDDFYFVECMEYLIHETRKPNYLMELGGWYYERKDFDLAEEYYLMAAELKYPRAYACLGYIYYYGRTDKPNHKKAFYYFSKSSKCGDITSSYKLADMYKNGYYVKKDYDKYVEIIKSLYPKIKDANNVFEPLPEIYSRLSNIYKKEGKIADAIELLLAAKSFQAQRLQYTDFFGDLTIMKYIILNLYELYEFDESCIDLFDLYYALQYPCTILLSYQDKVYSIQIIKENSLFYIKMNDTNYENADDFFSRATLENTKLSSLALQLDYVEITQWN